MRSVTAKQAGQTCHGAVRAVVSGGHWLIWPSATQPMNLPPNRAERSGPAAEGAKAWPARIARGAGQVTATGIPIEFRRDVVAVGDPWPVAGAGQPGCRGGRCQACRGASGVGCTAGSGRRPASTATGPAVTVLRILRRPGLLLAADYQRERRSSQPRTRPRS